jgi:hypothetical protein
MTSPQVRLGEALVQDAGLSREDLDRALALASARGLRLGSALVELGLFCADDIAMALAQQHGVASARDKHLGAIQPHIRAMITPATEQRLGAIAVALTHGPPPKLVVAMRDPRDVTAIAAIEAESKLLVVPAAAAASRLDSLIRDASAAGLAELIRDSVPPRPAGVVLTGASPLLDLDALPQRTTPWTAAARAAALEKRRARASQSPPAAQGTQPPPASAAPMVPPVAGPPPMVGSPRGTAPSPAIAALDTATPAASSASSSPFRMAAGGTRVAPASRPWWKTAAIVAAVIAALGGLGYAGHRLLWVHESPPSASPSVR